MEYQNPNNPSRHRDNLKRAQAAFLSESDVESMGYPHGMDELKAAAAAEESAEKKKSPSLGRTILGVEAERIKAVERAVALEAEVEKLQHLAQKRQSLYLRHGELLETATQLKAEIAAADSNDSGLRAQLVGIAADPAFVLRSPSFPLLLATFNEGIRRSVEHVVWLEIIRAAHEQVGANISELAREIVRIEKQLGAE